MFVHNCNRYCVAASVDFSAQLFTRLNLNKQLSKTFFFFMRQYKLRSVTLISVCTVQCIHSLIWCALCQLITILNIILNPLIQDENVKINWLKQATTTSRTYSSWLDKAKYVPSCVNLITTKWEPAHRFFFAICQTTVIERAVCSTQPAVNNCKSDFEVYSVRRVCFVSNM